MHFFGSYPVFFIIFWGGGVIAQVFSFSQKASVNFQLLLRLIQGVSFMLALAGIAVAIVVTDLSVPDIFACILAFVPTGWGILSVSSDTVLGSSSLSLVSTLALASF